MKKLNNKGFGAVEVLLILVIVGIIGGIGWYVAKGPKKANETAVTTPTQTVSTPSPTKSTVPAGFTSYENKELGFKFYAPTEWGSVKVTKTILDPKTNEGKGNSIVIGFTKNKKILAGMRSKDYAPSGGRDGACYITLGFTKAPTMRYEEKSDTVDFKNIDAYIINTSSQKLVEGFEYYSPSGGGAGMCPGLWFDGATIFKNNAHYAGIEIFWFGYENCCTQQPTLAEFNSYKKDKTSALSAVERQKIVTFFKSISDL